MPTRDNRPNDGSPNNEPAHTSVTIYDLSRSLNLSAMTISRVLNKRNAASVAPATRERVEQAARDMGYRPNRAARALVTGRTNTIAIWISHLKSSIYTQIVAACRTAIQTSGMEISVVEMDWHFPAPNSHRRIPWPVDGIIAVDPPDPELLLKLLDPGPWQKAPRVHIGSGDPVVWGGDFARIDMAAGARAAVEHLVEIGCQRIAYAAPTFLARPGGGHYDAYMERLEAAGLRPELILHDAWDMPSVRQTVREYVQTHSHPDGIFCHHDEMAIAVFRGLRDLGLHIPEDVAIIGCEGNEFLDYFDPPISTVAMPIDDLARTGWNLLQQRIDHPDLTSTAPQQITLPFELRIRASALRKTAAEA
jgi:DNA-binding LacI/PurR family transcriptional regulator